MKGWNDCPDCWGSGHVKGWGAKCDREMFHPFVGAPCGIDVPDHSPLAWPVETHPGVRMDDPVSIKRPDVQMIERFKEHMREVAREICRVMIQDYLKRCLEHYALTGKFGPLSPGGELSFRNQWDTTIPAATAKPLPDTAATTLGRRSDA